MVNDDEVGYETISSYQNANEELQPPVINTAARISPSTAGGLGGLLLILATVVFTVLYINDNSSASESISDLHLETKTAVETRLV